MYWSPFFHIYQPAGQSKEILERIANESYRPLIKGWLSNPSAKVTLNINACLSEMLVECGHTDIIEGLIKLAEREQLEFTSSGKYHPFLPILPEKEIERQIRLNDETNSNIFGEKAYKPQGFFPPEMGYSDIVGEVVQRLGFRWIILDEIAFSGKINQVQYDKLYELNLKTKTQRNPSSQIPSPYVFFRERRTSNLIMSAMVRTKDSLWQALMEESRRNRYLITAMDGETFGHHRPGLDLVLFDLYNDPRYQFVLISELMDIYKKQIDKSQPIECSWAASEKEIEEHKNFYLYFNSKNKLHVLQKRLIDLSIESIAKCKNSINRNLLDCALSCNHMWWSNPDSWWSIEEIERGAFALLKATDGLECHPKAKKLYWQIVEQAFEWQRNGLPRKLHEEKDSFKKIPFKNRAKPGEYEALLKILREEEKKAVVNREYELAIRWRDSIYKLEKGLDVYDFVHIIDQMRAEGKLDQYQDLARKFRDAYNKLSPGQPEK
jgi:hypothetical protein